MSRRALPLLLLVAAAAVVAWGSYAVAVPTDGVSGPRLDPVAPPRDVAPVTSTTPVLGVAVRRDDAVSPETTTTQHARASGRRGQPLEVFGRAVHAADGAPVPWADVTLSATFVTDGRGHRLTAEQIQAARRTDEEIDFESEVLATTTTGPGGQVGCGPVELPDDFVHTLHVRVFDPVSGRFGGARIKAADGRVDLGDVVVRPGVVPSERRARLTVRVLRDGRPVHGALVRGAWYWDDPEWEVVRTDGDGRVTLLAPQVHVDLMAESGDDVAGRDHVLVEGVDVEVTLQLEATRTLEGIVRDVHGRPVTGAYVVAYGPAVATRWAATPSSDTTSEDGVFRIRHVGPGPHILVATASDRERPAISAPLPIGPSTAERALVLTVEPVAELVVDVLGSVFPRLEAEVAGGAWVRVPYLLPQSIGSTYRLADLVPRGVYRLVDPWAASVGHAFALDGVTPRSLEWRPASTASRRVTGRVVRPDGAVISGARIRALDDDDGEVLATEWSAQRFGDAPGLEEGSFTVTIPERSLVLRLDVGAAAPTTLTLSAGAVDVDLGDVVVAPP